MVTTIVKLCIKLLNQFHPKVLSFSPEAKPWQLFQMA
jgi:hypothetical protein